MVTTSSTHINSNAPSGAIPFDQIANQMKADSARRGRGRPRKSDVGNASPVGAAIGSNGSSMATSANSGGYAGTAITPVAPSNVPAELVGTTLRALSAIPAKRFNNPGYLIDEKTALDDGKTLKPSVDMLLDKWLPHVGPYAVEMSFALAICSIAFRQYQAGAEFKDKQGYAKPDHAQQSESVAAL